jgi:copper(I)-binding protein
VSAVDDALVGASVDPSIAAVVEIHETVPADEAEGSMDGDTSTAGMMDDTATTGMMDDSTDTTGMGMAEGMVMQPIEELELPAGETVALEPGGYHIMLLELAEPLVAGDTFELTLTFREAGEQTVTVEVRDM